jgi:DNA polymerase III subunit epsilon
MRGRLQDIFRTKAQGEWIWYEALAAKLPSGDTPIREVPFVVLDLETTGLNPAKDRVLNLAAIPVLGMDIRADQALDFYLSPEYFDPASIPVHEIMPGKAEGPMPTEAEVLSAFLRMGAGAVWVAHFGDIDRGFLQGMAMRAGAFQLCNPILDTAKLLPRVDDFYREVSHQPNEWKLERVCQRLDIPAHGMHTAAGDAFATAILLLKMLRLLEKRGARKLKDLW